MRLRREVADLRPGPFIAPVEGVIDLAFALALAGVAALQELRTRPLPEWLALGAAIVAPAVHCFAAGMAGSKNLELLVAFGGSALGALACAVIPVVLLRRNVLRRTDVVLFIALGAALGPALGIGAEGFALFSAFAMAAIVAWQTRAPRWVPLAPAILGGVFLATVTTTT